MPHDWQEATCSTAMHCSGCGKTQGEPAPHTIQITSRVHNVTNAVVTRSQYCSVCGAKVNVEKSVLGSYADDTHFKFTPDQFLERFLEVARDTYPSVAGEWHSESGIVYAELDFGTTDTSEADYVLLFVDGSGYPIDDMDSVDSINMVGVILQAQCSSEGFGSSIDSQMIKVFLTAIDPDISQDKIQKEIRRREDLYQTAEYPCVYSCPYDPRETNLGQVTEHGYYKKTKIETIAYYISIELYGLLSNISW